MRALLRTLRFVVNHPLNGTDRLGALARFARWQVASRLMRTPQVVPFVDDTVLVMERGMTGATGNWYAGLHEHVDMGLALHLLRPGDVFADIGANVGSYTVLAAGAAGAHVHSFEPIPSTFAKLRRNLRINGLDDLVTAHQAGAGAETATLSFTAEGDTVNRVATAEEARNGATVDVPVVRVDDALDGAVPRLVKIDVEGWEAEVLKGMPETLRNPALVAIIMENNEADGPDTGTEVSARRLAREAGFEIYSYDPVRRKLAPGNQNGSNTIYLRDLAFVEARVTSAPRHRLVNGTI